MAKVFACCENSIKAVFKIREYISFSERFEIFSFKVPLKVDLSINKQQKKGK